MRTQRHSRILLGLVGAATVAALVVPGAAFAKGPGGGGGSGGGGGGGGGGKGELYSELVPLLRDVYGRPMLRAVRGEMCLQPVTYTDPTTLQVPVTWPTDPVTNEVNGSTVWLIPLLGDLPSVEEEVETCDPDPLYVDFLEEVQFGRLSVSRSPEKVLAARLAEAMAALESDVDGEITLDHAGRLVYTTPEVDEFGEFIDKTIDAPLENLALDKRLQEYGSLNGFDLPIPLEGYSFLDHAAAFFGAAADKPGKITADSIVYMNPVLITKVAPPLTYILGNGVEGVLGVKYVNYGPGGANYTYNRETTYPGCVAGWDLTDPTAGTWFNDPIMVRVFGGETFTGSNVNAFATRADDARAVGTYIHDAIDHAIWVTAADTLGESTVCEMVEPEPDPAISPAQHQ